MIVTVQASPATSNDGMASSSVAQHFSAMQGLPSIVVEDADLHSSRPGVFSPPPRPDVRPAVAVAHRRGRKQRSVQNPEEEESSADEYGEEADDGQAPVVAVHSTIYASKRFSRSMSQDDLVTAPLTSTPPFRARTGSAPSAGIKHERSRSHFSIPDVMVTSCEEEGNEVHFELQLSQQDRRIGLPSAMELTGVHSFPSSSSLSSNASSTSASTSNGSPTEAVTLKKNKKHTPPAIRIVDAEGQAMQSSPTPARSRAIIVERAVEAAPPVAAASTTTTNKIGQRLRKSSLPSLFSKRERDAARTAATSALPPSPTLPQYVAEQQSRRPSEPMPMRPRTGSLGDILTTNADLHNAAEGRANTQRNATQAFQSSSTSPLSSPTLSYTSSTSPASPTESSRSFSPLSAFFASNKKDAMANDGRMSGSLTPTSLSKKEMKQRQKEEKAMMKELEKVDRMVRKHDEKARKAAKNGGRSGSMSEVAPVAVAELPPATMMTTIHVDHQEGRTKKALRRITMFRANTGATPRVAVPTRKPSVKQRSDVQSCLPPQQQPSSAPESNSQTTLTGAPSRLTMPFRNAINDAASPDRGEWTDVPSPVGLEHSPTKGGKTAVSASTSATAPVDATPGTPETTSRRNSVRRALSARRRMSAAAGRAVRPRSSGQGDSAPPLPRMSSNASKDTPAAEPSAAAEAPAPLPSFARAPRPFLNAKEEEAKSRYRIESIVVEGSHLGWEEDLGVSWRNDDTPDGSGHATPKALASTNERTAPSLSLQDDAAVSASSSTSSPPVLAMSIFESLYKEVDAMELSFGEKYPAEAEVRRKSLSSESRRHSSSSSAVGVDGIDLKDAPPSPSLPSDYQFAAAMEAATAKGIRKARQSDGSGASYSEGQRSRPNRTTSASSSATSSASSNAIPATPPLPAGFAAFKSAAVVAVPSQWGSSDGGDATAPSILPSSSQQKQPSVMAAGRRIRVGANPRGFKFPPPPPVTTSPNEADGMVDPALEPVSPPPSNSTPFAL